jgi:potassium efflux system protein
VLAQERPGSSAEVQRHEAARSAALDQRVRVAQQLADEVERNQRMLGRWLDEIGLDQQQRSCQERAATVWVKTVAMARVVWGFELFSIEDTIEIQGQRVTTTRGVTVGKSIGAMLIFLVGYWLAALLAQRLERALISRFGVDARQARTVRRWAMTGVGLALLFMTLNLAQIPLTVFAFLGGALAIGVGFGTQTIIKNLISGLIVLMERQVRVGDSVEVDGFSGIVTEVNLRSSTIKGYDGIDAIVPNSTLLEGRVINWTMSDMRLRRVVRVGVAYGSPLRRVTDLIRGCAERHGQVLKQPEPQVLLEDFGENALTFALFVWIDLQGNASGPVIASDLRFMIEAALTEAGIAIAFPQRDIHLGTNKPLQVQITRRPPDAAS